MHHFSSFGLVVRNMQQLSSTRNPPDKDNKSHAQKSSNNEELSENSKAENSVETTGSSSFVQKACVTENGKISSEESHFGTSNEEGSVTLEKEKVTNSVVEEFTNNMQNMQVIMTYETRHRPRQPFFNQNSKDVPANQRLPVPPSYYTTNRRNINQPTPAINKPTQSQEHRLEPTQFQRMGELMLFPDIFINSAHWAQYPTSIPPDAPPCLAHLVDAEVLFIVQKIDFIQLLTGYSDLNMFLIQNKNSEYLYYVYETTDVCGQLCCRDSRNFQLHIMDMYQNEVIYLNKPCGCTYLCCCYPVIEVYAPPMIPAGAVMKVFNAFHEEFVIVDPDENVMFQILGSNVLKHCCSFYDFTFSIHALDSEKTVVGYIKRDFSGYFRTFFTDADLYGISFPKNMDVRIKAVFLGALFLIDIIYFDN